MLKFGNVAQPKHVTCSSTSRILVQQFFGGGLHSKQNFARATEEKLSQIGTLTKLRSIQIA